MREGAATVSAAGLILYANRRLAELLSCAKNSIVGASLRRFLAADAPLELIGTGGSDVIGTAVELDLIDADGTVVSVVVGSSPLAIGGQQFTCLTFTDLRGQKAQALEIAGLRGRRPRRWQSSSRAQTELVNQATHDALTDLPNRVLVSCPVDCLNIL